MTFPIIVDAHLDLAYNGLKYQRKYLHGTGVIRNLEFGGWQEAENGRCTVSFPDMMRGRVGIGFGTIFCEPARSDLGASRGMAYSTPKEAHAQGLRQLDWYRHLADHEPRIRLISSRNDLNDVLGDWGSTPMGPNAAGTRHLDSGAHGDEAAHRHIGLVLLMEGADPILEPKELEFWVERGVRIVGLAWGQTRYSGGTNAPGGLTTIGFELLEQMARLGVVLDVSHMAHKALMQALEVFQGAHVIASHSNPHKITPTDRHLPDEAIDAIAHRGGVMGVVLYNRFLKHDWVKGSKKTDVTMDHIIRCIDYVCQRTGSSNHVGIGSDFDGGFGLESIPAELNGSRDLYKIGISLLQRGYSADDTQKIMGGNWLRVLQAAL